MNRRRIKIVPTLILLSVLILIIISLTLLFKPPKEVLMIDLTNYTKEEVEKYTKDNQLILKISEENNYDIEIGKVIRQSISKDTKINRNDELTITISLGKPDTALFEQNGVDELGKVPIMMYHGIQNVPSSDTGYIGGNVDKDGYQRTAEAFRKDLEFYYTSGYRMIRLEDYINGIIDVSLGKSPIILTFDDGLSSNIKVTGLDNDGNIIIDPNSAIGILEEFKTKYPDFNITATFFLNGGLFLQPEYNDKIVKWITDHGYNIGNHTYNHKDLTKITKDETSKEVGSVYNLFDDQNIKYVNIVALPFGSPYDQTHDNFTSILNSSYNGKNYETIATLRVGWESEYSPFSKNFNKKFLKRIRAYDNNGGNSDIDQNFKQLEKTRFISDGNKDTITIKEVDRNYITNSTNLKVVTY